MEVAVYEGSETVKKLKTILNVTASQFGNSIVPDAIIDAVEKKEEECQQKMLKGELILNDPEEGQRLKDEDLVAQKAVIKKNQLLEQLSMMYH